jgi:hypothetical protein
VDQVLRIPRHGYRDEGRERETLSAKTAWQKPHQESKCTTPLTTRELRSLRILSFRHIAREFLQHGWRTHFQLTLGLLGTSFEFFPALEICDCLGIVRVGRVECLSFPFVQDAVQRPEKSTQDDSCVPETLRAEFTLAVDWAQTENALLPARNVR